MVIVFQGIIIFPCHCYDCNWYRHGDIRFQLNREKHGNLVNLDQGRTWPVAALQKALPLKSPLVNDHFLMWFCIGNWWPVGSLRKRLVICRTDSRLAPRQWKTSLHNNAVSEWLGANLESALLLKVSPWASYQIRQIAGCACAGIPGNVSPRQRLQSKLLVSDPGMNHDTCVTHVPWCMSGSLTRGGEENAPGIPGACATRNFTYLARGPWHDVVMR